MIYTQSIFFKELSKMFVSKSKAFYEDLRNVRVLEDGKIIEPNEEERIYFNFHKDRFYKTHRLISDLSKRYKQEARILDLGICPVFSTLLVKNLNIKYIGLRGAFYLDQRNTITGEIIVHTKLKDKDYKIPIIDECNIEKDKLPFDDASFDIVLFLEIIEHLILNPIHIFKEIARVLKPNGVLLLTTDNANSFIKLLKFISFKSIYWPYNDSSFGDRHNREYLPYEIKDLLDGIGYRNTNVFMKNLLPYNFSDSFSKYLGYSISNIITSVPFFSRFKRQIICIAERGEAKDYYPSWLFMRRDT